VIPSVTTMQMATIAIGAGTGGLASAEGYMFTVIASLPRSAYARARLTKPAP